MAPSTTGTTAPARPTTSSPFNPAVPLILLVALAALPAILGPQIASGFFDKLDELAAVTPRIVATGHRPGAAAAGAAAGAIGVGTGAVGGVGLGEWIVPVPARTEFVPAWLPVAAAIREGFDAVLSGLVNFFWVVAKGGPDGSLGLFGAYMAVQILPLHAAVMLEGMRQGNAEKWVSL